MKKIDNEDECIKKEIQFENISKRTRGLLPLWIGYRLGFYLCVFIKSFKKFLTSV